MQTSKAESIVLEFLEVATHQLLYLHEIYPSGIFARKAKYNIAVQDMKSSEVVLASIPLQCGCAANRCRCMHRHQNWHDDLFISQHSAVNSYITECLKTARDLLCNKGLTEFIILFSLQEVPVKKIVFDIASLQREVKISSDQELELALRDCFLRLSVSDRIFKPLPKNCSFKILLCTKLQHHLDLSRRNSSTQTSQNFPWLRYQPSHFSIAPSGIVTLSSVDSCGVKINIYAEEIESESLDGRTTSSSLA